MAEENAVLMYKGHPLMRKDNMIYYGSMADSHIVMLQVLATWMWQPRFLFSCSSPTPLPEAETGS